MKTTMIIFALLMGLSSHAQTQTLPKAWKCTAECFLIGGTDGANLYYYGNISGYIYTSQQDAFQSLKQACSGNAMLLKRKFKGISNQTTVENVFERDVSYYWYSSHERARSYQVINNQTKAQFDVSEADLNNSCETLDSSNWPLIYGVGGDPVRG